MDFNPKLSEVRKPSVCFDGDNTMVALGEPSGRFAKISIAVWHVVRAATASTMVARNGSPFKTPKLLAIAKIHRESSLETVFKNLVRFSIRPHKLIIAKNPCVSSPVENVADGPGRGVRDCDHLRL
jgi:hypothetical protein